MKLLRQIVIGLVKMSLVISLGLLLGTLAIVTVVALVGQRTPPTKATTEHMPSIPEPTPPVEHPVKAAVVVVVNLQRQEHACHTGIPWAFKHRLQDHVSARF
jgi:molybdopterin-biosynthesis enzyme MoeA-like protein